MKNKFDYLKNEYLITHPNATENEIKELFSDVSDSIAEQFIALKNINFDIKKQIDYHQKNSVSISYLNYVKNECDLLSSDVRKRKIVYLDTKYWVDIRKAVLNDDKNNVLIKLYNILKQKVAERKLVCPLSTEIVSELFRQSDVNTLNATIDIMDSLSGGVAYKFFFDKIRDDFSNYFLKLTNESCGISLKPMSDFVPVCMVMGSTNVLLEGNYADDSVQKATFDLICNMRFEYFGKFPGVIDSSAEQIGNEAGAERLNVGKKKAEDDLPSVKDACAKVFYANLNGFKEYIGSGINNIYYLEKNLSLKEISLKKSIATETQIDSIVSGIVYKFQQKQLEKDDIPLLSINSIIGGTVYSERNRKFHKNDFDDFRHAAIALPSSDYFFTEDSLAHLLNNTTKLSQKYDVKCVSKPEKALEMIEEI